jgi:hypothetical protein
MLLLLLLLLLPDYGQCILIGIAGTLPLLGLQEAVPQLLQQPWVICEAHTVEAVRWITSTSYFDPCSVHQHR